MGSIERARTSFVYSDVSGADAITVQLGCHRDTLRVSMEAAPYAGGGVAHLEVNQVRMLAARLSAMADEMESYF